MTHATPRPCRPPQPLGQAIAPSLVRAAHFGAKRKHYPSTDTISVTRRCEDEGKKEPEQHRDAGGG